MALKALIVALGAITSTAAMASVQPADTSVPAGSESTRYCMQVDPATGSRMETIQCYTRAEWAQLDVDLDKEWAENGVKTLG